MKVIDEISTTIKKWHDVLTNNDENRFIGKTSVDKALEDIGSLDQILEKASESSITDYSDGNEIDNDYDSEVPDCTNTYLDYCDDSNKNLVTSNDRQETTTKNNKTITEEKIPNAKVKANKKEIKISQKDHINLELEINTKNFYSNILKTGGCITKLFKDIDKDKFFTLNTKQKETASIPQQEIFLGETNSIDNACYMYNYKIDENAEKLEISVRGKDKGWVFMMTAIKNNSSSNYQIFYREFIVEKNNDEIWKVNLGQEGEIELSKDLDFGIAINDDDGIKKSNPLVWFDTRWNKPCKNHQTCWVDDDGRDRAKQKSLSFYWKPNKKSGETISKLLEAGVKNKISRQAANNILNHKTKFIYTRQNWWKSEELNNYRSLIKSEQTSLDNKKGEWKSLLKFCHNNYSAQQRPEEYYTYCEKILTKTS